MRHVEDVQDWLKQSGLSGLVVPSTDEFLSEFSPPPNRRLQWATGFSGSTGMAIILQDAAALFLDGRYLLQGASGTEHTVVDIESASLANRRAWLKRSLKPGGRVALHSWIHSVPDVFQWRGLAAELGFELEMLEHNPIDGLWGNTRPAEHAPRIVEYPVSYAGESHQDKCASLVEYLKSAGLQALLVADPEDVSWLLNVRATHDAIKTTVGDWHVVPSCTSRVLVRSDGRVIWYIDRHRLTPELATRTDQTVVTASPDELIGHLRDAASVGPVGADLRRTPHALLAAVEQIGPISAHDVVARRRWRKHEIEVRAARRVHVLDAAAVVRFMAWVVRTVQERTVTEFEAAEALETFRAGHPNYHGASMPFMSASGPSGAQPHYVPPRQNSRPLNDHPVFWMDSGGQYPGGTTDNTITLALGKPEARHVLAHTLVLQGFIALATLSVPAGTSAHRVDNVARLPLWREGMDFAHNTGHGVGNYLNIHEGPYIGREAVPATLVPLEPGMIVTNEPGYYAAGDFGVRIESHMVVVASHHPGFVRFDTISRLPIDPHMVDFKRLSVFERRWLADYHRTVLDDLEPLLDTSSAAWLRMITQTFIAAAEAP